MNTSKPEVAILDLFAGIWPHSLQVSKVAKILSEAGFHTTLLHCGGAINEYCTVNESRSHGMDSISSKMRLDCIDCKFTSKIGPRNSLTKRVNVKSLLNSELENKAEAIFLEARKKPIDVKFNFEGIPVVELSLYELILKFKKTNLEFNIEETKYFESILKNAIRFALAGKEFFRLFSSVDTYICYAPQYSINGAFLHWARLAGKKIFFLDGGTLIGERYNSITLRDWPRYGLHPAALQHWPGPSNLVVDSGESKLLQDHRSALRTGRSFSVYSSKSEGTASEFRRKLGLGKNEDFILLALSSYDEMFAGQLIGAFPDTKYPGVVFVDQNEWVAKTIEWFRGKEISLVIRFHPRDLPNKRERQVSEQSSKWQQVLKDLPPNIFLNTPEQKISIHDLLGEAKGFLTGWSSTALEALDYGIPTITYDRNMPAYPDDIHLTGDSIEEYFVNLEKILTWERPANSRELADKWLAFSGARGSMKISGRLFESKRLTMPRFMELLLLACDRIAFFIWRPLEFFITSRKTPEDAKLLLQMIGKNLDSIYEIEEYDEP